MNKNENLIDQKIIFGSSWQLLSVIVNSITSILVISIMARLVLPEAFGVIAMANSIVVFANLISEIGVEQYIIRKEKIDDVTLSSTSVVSIFNSLITYFILFILAPLISLWFNESTLTIVIRTISLIIVISRIGKIQRALLQKEMKFKKIVLIDLFSYIIGYAFVGVVLAFSGFGVWSIVLARIFQVLIQSILLITNYKLLFKFIFSINEIKKVFKFGFSLLQLQFINNFANQIDYILIGRLSNPVDLAYYERNFKIMTIPVSYVGNIFDKVMYSFFSKIQRNKEKLIETFNNILKFIFILVIPVQFLILVFDQEIILILLGENWVTSSSILVGLSIGIVFRSSIGLMDSLVRFYGKMNKSSLVKIIYAFILSLLILFSITFGDLFITAFVINIAVIINFILMLRLSGKLNGFNHFILFKNLLGTFSLNLVPFLFTYIIKESNILNLGIFFNLLLYTFIYFLLLIVIIYLLPRRYFKEYRYIYRILIRFIKKEKN